MLTRLIIFLILNFGALALGGLFTSKGVNSEWYDSLNKAHWTPPGWVFGFAWTTIMICFSFYMSFLWSFELNKKYLVFIFILQWVLNVSWNPSFFYFQNTLVSFVLIISLTILVTYLFFNYYSSLGVKSLLILPYVLWLFIATSLNGYILFMNK